MKEKKTCKNCINSIRMVVNSDILCLRKGVVSPGFVCNKHKMISFSDPLFYKKNKCIDCANYVYKAGMPGRDSCIGICRLFSVRYFDGRKKSACSKFLNRQELSVS